MISSFAGSAKPSQAEPQPNMHDRSVRGASGVARKPTRRRAARSGSAAPATRLARYDLRSTVRYRVEGRVLTGIVIGITHSEPVRYDIRRLAGVPRKRKSAERIFFGIAHEDVSGCIAPPPLDQKVIVLSDLPSERPPARDEQAMNLPSYWRFLAQVLGFSRDRERLVDRVYH